MIVYEKDNAALFGDLLYQGVPCKPHRQRLYYMSNDECINCRMDSMFPGRLSPMQRKEAKVLHRYHADIDNRNRQIQRDKEAAAKLKREIDRTNKRNAKLAKQFGI